MIDEDGTRTRVDMSVSHRLLDRFKAEGMDLDEALEILTIFTEMEHAIALDAVEAGELMTRWLQEQRPVSQSVLAGVFAFRFMMIPTEDDRQTIIQYAVTYTLVNPQVRVLNIALIMPDELKPYLNSQ